MPNRILPSAIPILLFFFVKFTTAQIPQLTVDGKTNRGVVLQKLQIEIKVCGTIAKTSWQMVFKNNTGQILEGTLNFPLKAGCAVSRYALDINGKIREAVPVDRGKGTVVFEAIERRRVDPGLLEKVEGNTFRTRIYPINAHSTRTVIIGYEEELPLVEGDLLRYYLPLNLKDTVADFSIQIEVIQSATSPAFDTAIADDLHFDKRNNIYKAAMHRLNYIPAHSLSFSIPKPQDVAEVMLQEHENKYYYLVNTRLQKSEQEKLLPKNITLLWDASLSGANRNMIMEKELLDTYFKKIKNATLTLVVFSNKIHSTKKYTLQNGDWEELKLRIDSIQYDGGTNLGSLQLSKLEGEEFLLMSDGRQTFGTNNIQLNGKPLYCINSSASADFSHLEYIALKSGGAVIDLQRDGVTASLTKLIMVPFRFLGIQQNSRVEENYPSLPVAVGNSFSTAGIASPELKEIILQFGYGNKVSLTRKIAIDPDKQSSENFDISKIFAQKKIAELDMQYEENKQAIESLGKRFGIVTRNTSLIVLETLNDYIQYNIEPPAELRNEYNHIMKQRSREITEKEDDNIETSIDMMDDLKSWWRTVIKKKNTVVKKVLVNNQHNRTPVNIVRPTNNGLVPNPTGAVQSLRGKVVEVEDGRPVVAAYIKVKGTPSGTQSDRNGNFSIRARVGDVLQYSAVGYSSVEIRISNNLPIHVILHSASANLEEVVVVGYGTQRRRDITGSVSVRTLPVNNLAPVMESVSYELAGKVAGVQVTNNQGNPGTNTSVIIRGNSTVTGSTNPLYIIDGRQSDQNSFSSDDIASMEVIESDKASAIYGARAANGVVIITTKNKAVNSYDSISIADHTHINPDNDSIAISFPIEIADYISIIKSTTKAHRYEKYLSLRKYYRSNPIYFFNVAGYFFKTGDKETGLRILSNLAELETGSYELYKMLGYKLKEAGDFEGEMVAFKKVLELRPLDPQSYRDYALSLEDAGRYQEALDYLQEGLVKSYSDAMRNIYEGIEEIFLMELNRLIALHSKKIKYTKIPKAIIHPLPVDLRVVMNWNMNNTDIDLWVTDPNGEKCMYSHSSTTTGGRISDDFTDGFGPEQFIIKKALKGKYRIEIDYFNDSQVTLAGPTTVMAEIWLHYGMASEEKRTITLQMEKGKSGTVFIGEVVL